MRGKKDSVCPRIPIIAHSPPSSTNTAPRSSASCGDSADTSTTPKTSSRKPQPASGEISNRAPFSETRYFLRWRPIVVSPISIYGFIGRRGLRVMWSELGWVWLPAALIFLAGLALRRDSKERVAG